MIFLFLFLLLNKTVYAETQTESIYAVGKTDAHSLFEQKTELSIDSLGKKTWSSEIRDSASKMVMSERAEFKDDVVIHDVIEQLQIDEIYEFKREAAKGEFITFKIKDGKKSEVGDSKKIDIESDFILPIQVEDHLQKKWAELEAGKTVYVDLGILELSKVLEFSFKKVDDKDDVLKIRMRPSNLLIAFLISPIFIKVNKKSKKITYVIGRTPLLNPDLADGRVMDAEIIYH